ncbi:integrator complex subunit 3 homolog [Scaptodrosophila lebanonensis]|uniref:Integrator complex subunit 3 homolog n=1 Tax=Drosophila lebanonensis TaxID=7225 RepID=A0A6J2UF68_DROLE|nr:integrator complex subunit 3 homolog [Scaptodrosophila lebanonensis]XP_030386053.1 integrator complex subunit 3 homolog [Scaptodrosophila lebanonensis]
MQLKAPRSRNMASLKDEEQQHQQQAQQQQQSSNRLNNNPSHSSSNSIATINNNHNNNNNNNSSSNEDELKAKRDSLEARKLALEQRLSEKSWLLQQIQKQETSIMQGNYEHMTINEFFAQLAQQYKHEQQLQALAKESGGILRRKQSTTSRDSQPLSITGSTTSNSNNNNNNNNRYSETHSNRSSEYDNYQPAAGDMLVIGVAQQQSQQQPHVKSALKKRPAQMQYMLQRQQQQLSAMPHQGAELYMPQLGPSGFAPQPQQQQHQQQQSSPVQSNRKHPDIISLISANSANVATLRQQHVAPQQQPIIVQCDKYYLSPTHQSYSEGGFIKSSQNIKKYVSPLGSPSAISYELQPSLQHQQHQRQLDAISLAPSYMSMDADQQQFRWRSQSHIPPLTPPQPNLSGLGDTKSHSSDMLAPPLPRYPSKAKPLDEISLSSLNTAPSTSLSSMANTIEKKPKPKQWLESSLDGPVVIRQMEATTNSNVGGAPGSSKPRAKLSSQSMSVSGRHYSMSAQRSTHQYPPSTGYAAVSSSKTLQHSDERYAKLSQSTSYLNAMEQTVGISASYALEPLDIPLFRVLPPKPNQTQQPTPPPRPPPAQHHNNNSNNNNSNSALQTALVSPPLVVASASLSPDIRIESPKNMTVVQQATFQPYKEITKPFEMSDFYKYSTKFKQKEGGGSSRAD